MRQKVTMRQYRARTLDLVYKLMYTSELSWSSFSKTYWSRLHTFLEEGAADKRWQRRCGINGGD